MLGAVPLVAIVLVARAIAITWRDDRSAIENLTIARSVLLGFGFDEWFNIAMATVLSSAVPALLLIAVLTQVLVRSDSDDVSFSSDNISWQTAAVRALQAIALAGAILLADWWAKPLILAAAAVALYSQWIVNPVVHLDRWRKVGARTQIDPTASEKVELLPDDVAPDMEAALLGETLASDADGLIAELHANRDVAFDSAEFRGRFERTASRGAALDRWLLHDKPKLIRALHRGRLRLDNWIREQRALGNGQLAVIGVVGLLSIMVVFDTAPWMPPYCATLEERVSTVYMIGGSPPMALTADNRQVVVLSDDAAESLSFGACSARG